MKLYKYCFFLSIIIICAVSIFMINVSFKSSSINKDIEEFKSRGVLFEKKGTISYYKVYPKYDYEDLSSPVVHSFGKYNYGTTGDIFTSAHDPTHNSSVIAWLSRKAWIGHSGIVYDSEGLHTLEITYNNDDPEYNLARLWINDWSQVASPRLVGVRVKGITPEKKEQLIEEMDKVMGSKYNPLFVFQNKNKYYCSSLISHIYRQIGIDLDNDGFVTLGADFIINSETYLIYYCQVEIIDNRRHKSIYFLCEEE